jgi:hypothetical protein
MIFLSLLALLYFLPTILAARRGHEIVVPLLLNLFFGWTVIVWFALLLWAALAEPPCYVIPACYYPPHYVYPPNYWRR